MKIAVPNFGSLSNRRVAWCIVSLVCLLIGSYLVGGYLILLIVLLLSVAGIVIGSAVNARLSSNNSNQKEIAPIWEDTPQIPVGWDYRPRGAIRRRAHVDLPLNAVEDPSSSGSATNENVGFSAIDSSAVDHEATVEQATEKGFVLGPADVVSTYDQSPIDNNGATVE
jgi:hypothetical protein